MKVKLYNQTGEEKGVLELPKNIFEVPMNLDLLHQVVVSQMANRKQNTAKTKDRSEVRGGGRKPWRQKGTGRARHGSSRSPIWIGGGVTFGPTGKKVLKKQIPVKMKRKALFMVLTAKAKDNLLLVLDELKIEKVKTKIMSDILNKLFLKKGSGVLVLDKKDDNIIRAAGNIPKIKTMQANELNALDLLNYKYVLMLKQSIKIIEETFVKK